jgi:hypothetical protein
MAEPCHGSREKRAKDLLDLKPYFPFFAICFLSTVLAREAIGVVMKRCALFIPLGDKQLASRSILRRCSCVQGRRGKRGRERMSEQVD